MGLTLFLKTEEFNLTEQSVKFVRELIVEIVLKQKVGKILWKMYMELFMSNF